MEVVIVGRTKMGPDTRCIGALTDSGESLRLLPPDGGQWKASIGFQVGHVWDLTYTQPSRYDAPHVENVLVSQGRYIRELTDLRARLLPNISPWIGGVDQVFGGFLRFTGNNNGYICRRVGVPDRSTWFWIPDRNLVLRDDGRHYDYPDGNYLMRGFAYVGEVVPPAELPAGTLVRVSLARWWSPGDADIEERCYLQLSGWL